jgi:hypothetical protein
LASAGATQAAMSRGHAPAKKAPETLKPYHDLESKRTSPFEDPTDGCYIHAEIKRDSRLYHSQLAQTYVLELNNHKTQDTIRKLYGLDAATYHKLYQLAFGILGAETQFGASPKYWFKERFPWAVASMKELRSKKNFFEKLKEIASDVQLGLIHESLAKTDPRYDKEAMLPLLFDVSMNSRGPTQVKYLPEKLKDAFPDLEKQDLSISSKAAVATVGYLAEAISRLRHIAKKNGCALPEDKLLDHLVYLYTGRTQEIINCTATIDKNVYYSKIVKAQDDVSFSRSPACKN